MRQRGSRSLYDAWTSLRPKRPDVGDALDSVVGLAILATPIAGGAALLPFLALLTAKSEVVETLKRLRRLFVAEEHDFTPYDRDEYLTSTYVFIVWSALLQELAETELRIGQSLREAIRAAAATIADEKDEHQQTLQELARNAQAVGHQVMLPNVADLESYHDATTSELYNYVARELVRNFLPDEAKKPKRGADAFVQHVAKAAVERLRLIERHAISTDSDYGRWRRALQVQRLELRGEGQEQYLRRIDQALESLRQLGLETRWVVRAAEEQAVVEHLRRKAEERVQSKVIRDTAGRLPDGLEVPTRQQIYVTPSYRQLVANNQSSLGSDGRWRDVTRRENLTAFVSLFLQSPPSYDGLCLVLGNPGAGKSLLLDFVGHHLVDSPFLPIRVNLRRVANVQDVQQVIEDAIYDQVSYRLDWGRFRDVLEGVVPVVLFDGYDELLQNSGRTHSDFLWKVRRWQENEADLGRPVKCVVTSRPALIGLSAVPTGTCVLRIEPFSDTQVGLWVDSWNRLNHAFYEVGDLAPFSPPEGGPGAEFAEQPLLLLMLALYYSDAGSLDAESFATRTRMYWTLVESFVSRELAKSADDNAIGVAADFVVDDAVVKRIRQLGVAAYGMYRRGKLAIRSEELLGDLVDCGLIDRAPVDTDDANISVSEELVGGFLFVESSLDSTSGRERRSYEFVHTTFAEFLVSFEIVNRFIDECVLFDRVLRDGEDDPISRALLSDPSSHLQRIFDNFGLVSLRALPLVLEMVRDWAPSGLAAREVEPSAVVPSASLVVDLVAAASLFEDSLSIDGRGSGRSHQVLAVDALLNLLLLTSFSAASSVEIEMPRCGGLANDVRVWSRLISWAVGIVGVRGLAELASFVQIGDMGSGVAGVLVVSEPAELAVAIRASRSGPVFDQLLVAVSLGLHDMLSMAAATAIPTGDGEIDRLLMVHVKSRQESNQMIPIV